MIIPECVRKIALDNLKTVFGNKPGEITIKIDTDKLYEDGTWRTAYGIWHIKAIQYSYADQATLVIVLKGYKQERVFERHERQKE